MDGMGRRLARLEASHSPPCEECGRAPNAPVEGYAVEWANSEETPTEPELCGKCGQQLVYVVTWGDHPGEG